MTGALAGQDRGEIGPKKSHFPGALTDDDPPISVVFSSQQVLFSQMCVRVILASNRPWPFYVWAKQLTVTDCRRCRYQF